MNSCCHQSLAAAVVVHSKRRAASSQLNRRKAVGYTAYPLGWILVVCFSRECLKRSSFLWTFTYIFENTTKPLIDSTPSCHVDKGRGDETIYTDRHIYSHVTIAVRRVARLSLDAISSGRATKYVINYIFRRQPAKLHNTYNNLGVFWVCNNWAMQSA